MNKDNVIEGRDIFKHPFGTVATYSKTATVLAAQADNPGIVKTPEGDMTFQAGDYIVTDNPPSHVWPVRQQVFESTYVEVGTGFEPRIQGQDVGLIGGVTEGAPKGVDQRGFPPQGQPPVPGYAQEVRDHARLAAQAAERAQQTRTPSAAPKAASKAPAPRK
jgi:hypothetical protein